MPGAHVKSNWPQIVKGEGEMDYFCRKDSNASRFWGIFAYFWRKDRLNSGASGGQRKGGRRCSLGCRHHCLGWIHR